MPKEKPEARIILTRGTRLDLKATIVVYDVNANRVKDLGITCGPSQRDIDDVVLTIKGQLERAGNRATVLERR